MMNEEFEYVFNEILKKMDIIISENQIRDFYKYMELLIEWNKKFNLTAITEPKDIVLKHFIDSLTILKYIKKEEYIVDIGTGAGFPGIPLAIVNKEGKFVLVDSLNKRISFLNEVIEKIELNNIETLHIRAEEFGQNKLYREKFDKAVSRAVANLSVLAEYLIPTVKVGGKIICMKGSKIDNEVEEAQYAIEELGGKLSEINKFCLPGTNIERNIIIIDKIKSTKKIYPRKAGNPAKKPLKY